MPLYNDAEPTRLFDALGLERGGDATTAADYLEEARAT